MALPPVRVIEVEVRLRASHSYERSGDLIASFEAKLARSLATVEDELRSEFPDGEVELDHD